MALGSAVNPSANASPVSSVSASLWWTRGEGTAGTVRTVPITVVVTGSAACSGTNGTDVAIPDDGTTATSAITIAGCAGNANPTARLEVHVAHTNIGDLQLRLIGPGGTVTFHNRDGADMNTIDKIYTLDLSAQAANGTWTLEATDLESGSTGKIDSWTLTLK